MFVKAACPLLLLHEQISPSPSCYIISDFIKNDLKIS